WLALLDADGVTPRLLIHQPIARLSPRARDEVRRQIAAEHERALRLLPPMGTAADALAAAAALPLARAACDAPGRECPWQPHCYGPDGIPAAAEATRGLYRIRPAASPDAMRRDARPASTPVPPRTTGIAASPIAAS